MEQHPKQREWDALLIFHWRKLNTLGTLFQHAEDLFGAPPHVLKKEGLKRVPDYLPFRMGMRTFIAEFLKPLSEKLWDVSDNKRVLDWLNSSTGLDIEKNKANRRYYDEAHKAAGLSQLHADQERISREFIYGGGRRMDNPNQIKSVRSGTKRYGRTKI